MAIKIKAYETENVREAIKIWNEIVREGIAFPQEDELDEISGDIFFKSQSFTGLAVDERFWLSIFSIQITSDVAGTSATQVTPFVQTCAGVISENL